MYRRLDPVKIIETAERLRKRVSERFPESGLARIASEIESLARDAAQRSEQLRRPNVPLRSALAFVLLLVAAVVYGVVRRVRLDTLEAHVRDALDFVQMVESGMGAVVFLGAAVLFLWTFENRLKRARTLGAIYELRSIAHVVDMHQLTKDPERICGRIIATASSPERRMTPLELNRYLDYCSEILALLSKIAVVYVQGSSDGVVLDAVDQIETLTTGLARKIWQKISLLERLVARDAARAAPSPTI
jgi:hypothetical protein